LTAGNPNS